MKAAAPLAKNILAPLGITVAELNYYARIKKKIHVFGTTILIILKEEPNGIMKVVQALEHSNILLTGITKTIENETKERKGEFLGMLLRTLGASLLGNMLAGKGIERAGYGNKQEKGMVRTGYGSKKF